MRISKLFRGDVYVARVIGAVCNCLPAEGETHNVSCQDYRFPQSPGSTVITAELTNRGRCYAESGYGGNLRVCSNLDTEVIPEGTKIYTHFRLGSNQPPPLLLCEISQILLLLKVEWLVPPPKWTLLRFQVNAFAHH